MGDLHDALQTTLEDFVLDVLLLLSKCHPNWQTLSANCSIMRHSVADGGAANHTSPGH